MEWDKLGGAPSTANDYTVNDYLMLRTKRLPSPCKTNVPIKSKLFPSGNTLWWLHKFSLQNHNTLAFALENVIQSNTHLVVVQSLSRVWLFATPWTVAHQAPLSMGFPRQDDWIGLACPSPGDLPDPGIKPSSPALAGRFFTTEPPGKSQTSTDRTSNLRLFLNPSVFLLPKTPHYSHTLALLLEQ